jgi:hypothetical protein
MRALALLLAAFSVFFAFYTVRLLVVTRFLHSIRAGGNGAYVGAVAFPVLAIGLGMAARACWRRSARPR